MTIGSNGLSTLNFLLTFVSRSITLLIIERRTERVTTTNL